MGLEELQPGNTLRAKVTAITAFGKFLKAKEVEEKCVRECIESDESGKRFVCVMDKFGMYLAFNEGKKGKPLARNTAMQYYRRVKLWLLNQFPQHRASLEARLLKLEKTLDNFYMKRDGGGFVSKASSCTKSDLKSMLVYLYTYASSESDYQDAALLCLFWYLFGRASDLSMVCKRDLSVDAADVLFLRLVRVKTSEEQELSLFPDTDFTTCPLLDIALALITQDAPSSTLITNLPEQVAQTAVTPSPDVPLVELLNATPVAADLATPATASHVDTAPTIYAHVNRVLDRVAPAAGVKTMLTSYSFRQGGVQHANGCDQMTARWIFNRGSWNMSTINKGFNYILNTSREDHKIANVLSGYNPSSDVPLQDLRSFDTQALDAITGVQRALCAACHNFRADSFNVNKCVLDVLTARVFCHFPVLKDLNSEGPVVKRIEDCVALAGCTLADLLAWSSYLAYVSASCEALNQRTSNQEAKPKEPSQKQKTIDYQAAVIKHFIDHVKKLAWMRWRPS